MAKIMIPSGAQSAAAPPDHASLESDGAWSCASVDAGPLAIGEGVRLVALAALTVTLIVLCVVLTVPVLHAIAWAVALAVLAWPMHRGIARRVASPGLAAALSSAVVVGVIAGTVLVVTYRLAREAASTVQRVGEGAVNLDLREQAARLPIVGRLVSWMGRAGLDIEQEVRRLVASYTGEITAFAQGSVATIIQFLVAVFVLYYLLRDREAFVRGLRQLLPLSVAESDLVLSRASDSIYGILHAGLVVSVIDATSFGLLFWRLGLPAPLLWAVVIFIVSLLPVLGATAVWVPAAVYLALTGRWLAAAALFAWGLLTFVFVDNGVYVRLAGARMRMHQVPALVSFLGGVAVFGISGIILGPFILAVTAALLEVWKRRMATFG
jgi:predicted PurR-regulated permease PerM